MNMNIIGRITKDAQVRNLPNDKQVVNFSVAINESYRNRTGERIQQTTYFDCAYWRTAKVAKLLTKGTLVELTGRVSSRAWLDKSGQLRAGLDFHTSNIILHFGAKNVGDSQTDATENSRLTQQETEDLPF
jgi:single-strand DNA-binding protein